MREIDVVYLYENVAREMDVACAVTAILQQRHGLSVEIVQWPQSVPRLYGAVTPRVVILPFCYFEHSFDCLLEWRKAVFVNLSWEQLFYRGNIQAKTPRGTFAVQHVLHHAWSEDYARFARQQSIPDEHVFVNGQPAYTLYDQPYRQYFHQRAELASRHRLDPGKRWVFFPENYNWAFYSDQMLKFFLDAGQSPEEVMEMREFCSRSFQEVMQWLANLARTGEVEVIVRPRPSTSMDEFAAAVGKVLPEMPRSMHVIQAESVREWILASEVVVSSHSTSLIEAAVAGKRTWMLAPFEMPEALRQVWHGLVPRIRTEHDLIDACLLPGQDHQKELEQWARSTLMSSGDAIEALAAYILRVVRGEVCRPPVPSRLAATAQGNKQWLPKWIWFVLRRLRAAFRRVVPRTIDVDGLREFVSAEEIDRRIARWGEVLEGGRGQRRQP